MQICDRTNKFINCLFDDYPNKQNNFDFECPVYAINYAKRLWMDFNK